MHSRISQSKHILVVDDEATLAFFLKRELEEAELTFKVNVASSGEEALRNLTYQPYDLLVTDLHMPGISGFTLIEVARSLYPNIKVILITAFGSHEVEAEADTLQIDSYLTKPFATSQLTEEARTLLMDQPTNLYVSVPSNNQD